MTNDEATNLISRIRAVWPNSTMSVDTAREYARALLDEDHDEINHSIDTLRRTHKWMPSIAELLGGANVYLDGEGDEIDENSYNAQQLGKLARQQPIPGVDE